MDTILKCCGKNLKDSISDSLNLTVAVGKYSVHFEAETFTCKVCGRNTTVHKCLDVLHSDVWERDMSISDDEADNS
jgi:hypothetical protein